MSDHDAAIDAAWHDLQPLLVRYDGTAARDLLQELDSDAVWNAVYWRTHKWLVSWFVQRDPRATTLEHPGHSFAEECLANFMTTLWPDRRVNAWKGEDLPRMLSELRTLGNELHRQRYPSREVHS